MKASARWMLAVASLPLLLAGCGAGADVSGANAQQQQQQDYSQNKQMVLDILQSTDGKKALAQALQDPSLRTQWLVSQTDVSKAMEKALTTGKDKSLLAQQLKDPKFASHLAKAIGPQLIDHQKQLMKDPTYQKDFMVLLKSPEFTQQLQTLMQTPQFRGQIMQVMTDALKNPAFRLQFEDALKSAVAEQMKSAGQQGGKGGGGSQGQKGGGSGDGSGSDGSSS